MNTRPFLIAVAASAVFVSVSCAASFTVGLIAGFKLSKPADAS